MDTEDPRFDITWDGMGPQPAYHFCREWDDESGCYGTNPNHGATWEEVREEVAAWHEKEAARWRTMTYAEWAR